MRGGIYDLFFRPDGFSNAPTSGALPPLVTGADPPVASNNSRTHDPVLEDLTLKARADTTCEGWKAWQRRLLSEFHVFPLSAATYQLFTRQGIGFVGGFTTAQYIRRTK
jgi:hypothetical protein